jgi:hypothetical protein
VDVSAAYRAAQQAAIEQWERSHDLAAAEQLLSLVPGPGVALDIELQPQFHRCQAGAYPVIRQAVTDDLTRTVTRQQLMNSYARWQQSPSDETAYQVMLDGLRLNEETSVDGPRLASYLTPILEYVERRANDMNPLMEVRVEALCTDLSTVTSTLLGQSPLGAAARSGAGGAGPSAAEDCSLAPDAAWALAARDCSFEEAFANAYAVQPTEAQIRAWLEAFKTESNRSLGRAMLVCTLKRTYTGHLDQKIGEAQREALPILGRACFAEVASFASFEQQVDAFNSQRIPAKAVAVVSAAARLDPNGVLNEEQQTQLNRGIKDAIRVLNPRRFELSRQLVYIWMQDDGVIEGRYWDVVKEEKTRETISDFLTESSPKEKKRSAEEVLDIRLPSDSPEELQTDLAQAQERAYALIKPSLRENLIQLKREENLYPRWQRTPKDVSGGPSRENRQRWVDLLTLTLALPCERRLTEEVKAVMNETAWQLFLSGPCANAYATMLFQLDAEVNPEVRPAEISQLLQRFEELSALQEADVIINVDPASLEGPLQQRLVTAQTRALQVITDKVRARIRELKHNDDLYENWQDQMGELTRESSDARWIEALLHIVALPPEQRTQTEVVDAERRIHAHLAEADRCTRTYLNIIDGLKNET